MEKDEMFYNQMFENSLQHKMQFRPDYAMEDIHTYINAIGSYNEFNTEKVLTMIDKIDSLIPRAYYSETNPNNGNRLWTMDIGREYSPVIYITIEVKSLGEDSFNPDIVPIIITEGEALAKEARADEISHEIHESEAGTRYHYKCLEFRFWWD